MATIQASASSPWEKGTGWEKGRPIDAQNAPGRILDAAGNPYASEHDPNATPSPPRDPSVFHRYDQISTVLWKVDWTKQEVDDALRQHELGLFATSALLAEAMTRDDSFDAVLHTRVGGLLGLDKTVTPSTKGPARGAKKIASAIDGRFEEFFERHALSQLLRWGILMGFAIAQIIWEPNEDGTEWLPSLDVWHPVFTYVRLDTQEYIVYTTEGPITVTPGDGQWLLYTPYGRKYGWFNGAIRSVAIPWLARQYAWRDWLRWSELYSLGIRKAIVPANADQKIKNKFYAQVAAIGAAPVVLCEENESGKKYDLQTDFPDATKAAESFEKLLNKCESKIAIRINGQNLTTEVKGGSYAAAKVHENVKQDILQSDSTTLGDVLSRDVITPYISFHDFPAKTTAPIVGWVTATPDDAQQSAEKVGKVATAMNDFKTAGSPVDERALLTKFDVPVLPEGVPVPTLPAPAAPAAPGDASKPKAEPPANTTASDRVALRRGGREHAVEGQTYVDKLVTKAGARGRSAIAPHLRSVKQALADAKDYDDLKIRLKQVLRTANSKRLEKVVERTLLMAHLAGRHSMRLDTHPRGE